MQKSQKAVVDGGGVWLAINSSAEGKQGHLTPALAKEVTSKLALHTSALLLDPDGKVGRAYGARTTPHLFVIDRHGKVAYQGAIDDKPSTDEDDVPGAHNYVLEAVAALKGAGSAPVPSTEPYGCGVKYR
jgi:hypothetical protein